MSTNKQALRQLACRATPGPWTMEHENIWYSENGYTKHLAYFCQGDDVDDNQDDVNTQYVATANPATVLALLDELEAAERRTITVKLPADYYNADGSLNADMMNTCAVVGAFRAALTAVGITVKGDSE